MTQINEKVNYRISENREFSSREVYFDGKPSEAVRTALKALKMRWHSVKKCWYGYASEHELIAAILGTEPDAEAGAATVHTDGYLGGGAVYGNKSGKYLHGADLSAAIRADIKHAGGRSPHGERGLKYKRRTECAASRNVAPLVENRIIRLFQSALVQPKSAVGLQRFFSA